MPEQTEITVINKLAAEQRDLNVYHLNGKSANLISHGRSLKLTLQPAETGDYVHISVVRGPGSLAHNCLINMPSLVDFNFTGIRDGDLIHQGNRTLLTIPPGPPDWQIEITRPSKLNNTLGEDFIAIEDI